MRRRFHAFAVVPTPCGPCKGSAKAWHPADSMIERLNRSSKNKFRVAELQNRAGHRVTRILANSATLRWKQFWGAVNHGHWRKPPVYGNRELVPHPSRPFPVHRGQRPRPDNGNPCFLSDKILQSATPGIRSIYKPEPGARVPPVCPSEGRQCDLPHLAMGWVGLVAGILSAGAALAQPPTAAPSTALYFHPPRQVPLDELPPRWAKKPRRVVEQPTLTATGPVDEFAGRAAMYQWLLDHPDRASRSWHRLGTPCLEIVDRGNGRFGWTDNQGSDLFWQTVHRTKEVQSGTRRAGPARACCCRRSPCGRWSCLRHKRERCPTSAANSPPGRSVHSGRQQGRSPRSPASSVLLLRWPEQGVTQMQLFFSALSGTLTAIRNAAEIPVRQPSVGNGAAVSW